MVTWKYAVLTDKGVRLLAKMAGGGTVAITKAKVGRGTVSPTDLRQQTELIEPMDVADLQTATYNDSKVMIPVLYRNDNVAESFDMSQLGFYANDPDEGLVLYAIAQAEEPRNIPSSTEMPGYSFLCHFYFSYSNDVNMEISIDPSGLVTHEEFDTNILQFNSELSKKVDAVAGKVLSSNDYTDGEKLKLSGIAVGANKYIHPSTHAASMVIQDSTHRFATDVEKVSWNAKAETTNPVFSGSYSQNRSLGSTVGKDSHAEGGYGVASGDYSHVEGVDGYAMGKASHAEGDSTEANSHASHAEGDSTLASGSCAHAEGINTIASGDYSHAEGLGTKAYGLVSHAEGYFTETQQYQHVQGHYNNKTAGTDGSSNGTSGTAFVIGNGTASSKSNAMRVNYNGQIYAKLASINTGADYAEYFEWNDGNQEAQDRVGHFVTFANGDKISIANEGDYILGIASGNPSVIGNGDEDWSGRFVRDHFNRFIMMEYEEMDEVTGEKHKIKTYKENPDYDPEQEYVQRSDRPEWDAIGMVGVLSVYDDGTCQLGGYCKCADGGIATAADAYGFGTYRVIQRVTENIIKVVFR